MSIWEQSGGGIRAILTDVRNFETSEVELFHDEELVRTVGRAKRSATSELDPRRARGETDVVSSCMERIMQVSSGCSCKPNNAPTDLQQVHLKVSPCFPQRRALYCEAGTISGWRRIQIRITEAHLGQMTASGRKYLLSEFADLLEGKDDSEELVRLADLPLYRLHRRIFSFRRDCLLC